MLKYLKYFLIVSIIFAASCNDILDPAPVDLQVAELALNDANDVASVETGLYTALRSTGAPTVVAGDFTADMITHRGTFTQYKELGTKQIPASNVAVSALWGSLYNTIYIANLILEKLPDITGLPASRKKEVLATAHFLRGYAYFIGAHTYGGIPLVTSTDRTTNRNIPRATKEEILALVLADYQEALAGLPEEPANAAFAGKAAARAALARYYLYQGEWAQAEQYTTAVIDSGKYALVDDFGQIVQQDFTPEAILELGYSANDDPGTNDLGLNNLFVGRREVIPSNQVLDTLNSAQSGDRKKTVSFDPARLRGTDNGWIVAKYGTEPNDLENNNIMLFRLAEMYLIRAEARARQEKISGANSAEEDINVLRVRAKAPTVTATSQSQILSIIMRERMYELAYEGHRWYDLKRTGRLNVVMAEFSPNWKSTYDVWPIPQREILNNPALANAQNPGY